MTSYDRTVLKYNKRKQYIQIKINFGTRRYISMQNKTRNTIRSSIMEQQHPQMTDVTK